MYLDQYKIEGTVNLDHHACFEIPNTDPDFQRNLENMKYVLEKEVDEKSCKSFYKFGDGDYHFFRNTQLGSSEPGRRDVENYNNVDFNEFYNGVLKNDYFSVDIYPENKQMFKELCPHSPIHFHSEFIYGLVANRWIFSNFNGKVGLIGADTKLNIIKNLMNFNVYRDYIGVERFNDYIGIPQKFACNKVDEIEEDISNQLIESTSDIFLVGIGLVHSALLYRFKKYTDAVFFEIGSGICALAGVQDYLRPYFGDWINFRLKDYDYSEVEVWRDRYDKVVVL